MNKVSRALQTDYTEPQVPLTSHILHSFLPDSRVSLNCVPHAVQMRRSRVEVIFSATPPKLFDQREYRFQINQRCILIQAGFNN